MVECHLAKVKVASSNLVSRFAAPDPRKALFYTKIIHQFYTSMNDKIIDPFAGFALDCYPYTCQKYGTDKTALLIEICYRAELSPLESFGIIESYLPLTQEEQEQQSEMIEKTMKTMFMLQPELKKEFEEFQKKLNLESQQD